MYLLSVFITGHFSTSSWDKVERLMFVGMTLMFIVVGIIITSFVMIDVENKKIAKQEKE